MNQQPIPPAIAKIAPDGNLTPRQRRRIVLDMALRRVRPGTGSSHEFMRRRTAMNEWPDLRQILDGIDWVIVGGVATRAYMPERMTKDLYILVRERDGEAVLERLQAAGYKIISQLAVPGYLLLSPAGVDVDVIFGNYSWLEEALAQPESDPAGYPVLALPYLVLMKLDVSRSQDVADISRMVGWASDEELDAVREVIARYRPDDRDDLESIIFIGQKEREFPE
jgi:hypothetical protein